ncbi:PLD nuclease N-terminal domain-containing protein [Jannaschia sp. S6380]|uniref:PLDc N-terminal domain-containing protein n=1 Tax=Jannaschia sp. S6380 TaxID=2926408 RepID=UPI001FF6A737|nr:PLD nuclease N-terminal domain-containing protein [Jannaschia sp. S6380]MCK0168233.1 PLD nuclease N-terminal domain-containing protein [Jannaschia sp. S6380]
MEYGIIGLLILAANIYAIYHVITSGASTMAKVLWTLGILIFPVLGVIAWFIAGSKGHATA